MWAYLCYGFMLQIEFVYFQFTAKIMTRVVYFLIKNYIFYRLLYVFYKITILVGESQEYPTSAFIFVFEHLLVENRHSVFRGDFKETPTKQHDPTAVQLARVWVLKIPSVVFYNDRVENLHYILPKTWPHMFRDNRHDP